MFVVDIVVTVFIVFLAFHIGFSYGQLKFNWRFLRLLLMLMSILLFLLLMFYLLL